MTVKQELRSPGKSLTYNAALNLAGSLVPMLVGCVTIPRLIGGFQLERYGVLTLAWTVIGYFSLFDLGLGRALTKIIAEKMARSDYKKDVPALVWTGVMFMAGLGVVGGLVLWLFSNQLVNAILNIPASLKQESLQTFHLLCLATPIVVITSGIRGIIEGQQRFDIINGIRVPMGVLMFLGPLSILPFSHSIFVAVMSLVIVRLLACIMFVAMLLRTMPRLRAQFVIELGVLGPLLHFGGWMTVTNIIGPLMTYLDRFLVGSLLSMSAVVFYTTPFDLIATIGVFPTSIVSVLFPAFAATVIADPAYAIDLCAKALKVIFIGLFPIVLGIITLARPGLGIWLGSGFAQNSTHVLQYLAFGLFLSGLAQVPFALVQAVGRPDVTAKLHMMELPFYLLIAWWLIRAMGIEGAALAYIVRVGVDGIALFAISQKMLVRTKSVFHRNTIFTVLIGILCLFIGLLPLGIPEKIVFLIIAVTSFFWFAWFFLLNVQERGFGERFLQSLTGSFRERYP